jgi:predicted nucleic acid-binding protein
MGDAVKFANILLEIEGYERTLCDQIKADDCNVYMDTNVLFWLYRLNLNAREEFKSWIKHLKEKNRIFIPSWAANEYNKHVTRNQDETFFPFKKVGGRVSKDLDQLGAFAKLIVDDNFVRGTTFSNRSDFIKTISESIDNLQKAIGTLKKVGSKEKEKVHKDIVDILEDRIIDNNIYQSLYDVSLNAKMRFHHELPPGYEDSDKENNSYGDLILWNEIITHCKISGCKKTILISNDVKRDWVYKPQNLKLLNGALVSNDGKKARDYYLPAPQLINEFRNYSGSDSLSIVDISTLIEHLYKTQNTSYKHLAEAVQIISSIEELESMVDSTESLSEDANNHEFISDVTTDIQEAKPTTFIDDVTEEVSTYNPFLLSEAAIRDKYYELDNKNNIDDIIDGLKSHNWHVQNPTISRFISTISSLPFTPNMHDSWFVLGRNVFQAASGGSFAAIEFLANIKGMLNRIDEEVACVLLAGIIFEPFFDSEGRLRKLPKSSEYLKLSTVCRDVRYKRTVDFLNSYLDFNNALTLYRLGQPNETIHIEALVNEELSTADIGKLSSLMFQEKQLSKIVEDKYTDDWQSLIVPWEDKDEIEISKEDLIHKIADYLNIPMLLLQIDNPKYDRFMIDTNIGLRNMHGA